MIAHKNYVRPTLEENRRITLMLKMECVCCAIEPSGWPHEKPRCHHIVEGNKRLGHWFTLPICDGHHQGDWTYEQRSFRLACKLGMLQAPVSLAQGSKLFTAYYGTQRELWLKVQHMLGLSDELPRSKIYKRPVLLTEAPVNTDG